MWSHQHEEDLVATDALMLELSGLSAGRAAQAAQVHLESGGKRIRARLALSAGMALQLGQAVRVGLAAGSELLHNASLIHDDIQDRSLVRREAATIWTRHGIDTAICAGDLLISAAYAAAAGCATSVTVALFARMHMQISRVIAGQCANLEARSTPVETLARYQAIAHAKSAPLLALPLDLCVIAGGQPELCQTIDRAAGAFAIAYQMADDIEDIEEDRETGEPNVVLILGGRGRDAPQADEARALAAANYRRAAELASTLPSGCGDLLADFARVNAEKLSRTRVAA